MKRTLPKSINQKFISILADLIPYAIEKWAFPKNNNLLLYLEDITDKHEETIENLQSKIKIMIWTLSVLVIWNILLTIFVILKHFFLL